MPDAFDQALRSTLNRLKDGQSHGKQSQDDKVSTTSSLSQTAILENYRQLEKYIKSPFACGGTIAITDNQKHDGPKKQTSPPENIFWTKPGSTTTKLVLPPKDGISVLQQLVKDCEPATLGRGQEEVLEKEDRKAGKLDPEDFATTFHSADFGIV
ncbi:uncharacterized protein BDV17DRAFT_249375 [Aspergillus undulatus]|uniref:uncharacterized protein n=1 Tax=Aspergillus undulatus TaxID=1810928 RepID=UPI003CCD93A9